MIAAIDERIEAVKASVAGREAESKLETQQRTTLAQLSNRKAARGE